MTWAASAGATGGGRVTELVARPLLAALRPELGCILQPLGGEYAATRELLTSVPFAPGYGVEIGLLVDTFDRLGLDAIAQVNLGVRAHRNRPLAELGAMSRQVIATLLSRCGIPDSGVGLTQFFAVGPTGDGYTQHTSPVSLADRPPMNGDPAGRAEAALLRRGVGGIGQYRSTWRWCCCTWWCWSWWRSCCSARPVCCSVAASSCRRCRGGRRATVLPAYGVTGADVDAVKFTQVLRGYKTSEVDWVLDRLGPRARGAARPAGGGARPARRPKTMPEPWNPRTARIRQDQM